MRVFWTELADSLGHYIAEKFKVLIGFKPGFNSVFNVCKLGLGSTFLVLLLSSFAFALRAPDLSGDDSGAVAVYSFSETSGLTTYDSSGVSQPLDLTASTFGNLPTGDSTQILTNAFLQSGNLLINPKPNGAASGMPDQGYQSAQRHRTFMASSIPAANLNGCTTGFTIQAFLRPWFPFQGSQAGNLIVGLSNSDGLTSVVEPNFAIYQSGMAGSESIMLKVRTGANSSKSQTSVPGAFSSVRETDNPGKLTEVIATQEPNGILTVYVNRMARSSLVAANPVFSPNAKLVIGNELVPLSLNADQTTNLNEQRNWSGEIHHLAIYCRGFTRNEILGAVLANKSRADIVRPLPRSATNGVRQEARRMVERLTGISIPIDHSLVLRVEARLLLNDRVGAAKLVTGDKASGEPGHPDFLNTVVKQFAMRMSNREETIRAPFNDMAAAFIGITRDELSAKELLTGDFFYMANPNKAKVRSDLFRDILISNNHYADLEAGQWDLGKVLMKVPGPDAPSGSPTGQQIAIDVSGGFTPNPDPAGVITSRAFMSAHAIAGTNRRMVEYSFREFMCIPMSEMADTSASPARIGRDVDRMPGGDSTKFETNCKGCHTQMDGFRGAFAKFDFANLTIDNANFSFIRNTQANVNTTLGFENNEVDQYRTVRKMNHNENTFPNGFTITDDSFMNNAIGATNGPLFGWSGANKLGGVGANQFGRMLADSNRFSQCMAKRAFEAVCTPNLPTSSKMNALIDGFAAKFKANGYNLKALFQEVAANPVCAMTMGR